MPSTSTARSSGSTSVGKGTNGWGSGTSPILYKDTVIVNASVESGALVALDKTTGKEVWRAKGITESWSTPVPGEGAGREDRTGRQRLEEDLSASIPTPARRLWHAESFNWYVCPSVVAHDGVVYALAEQHVPARSRRAAGATSPSRTPLWQKNLGSVVTSPVYHEGHLYWADGGRRCA